MATPLREQLEETNDALEAQCAANRKLKAAVLKLKAEVEKLRKELADVEEARAAEQEVLVMMQDRCQERFLATDPECVTGLEIPVE